jgi:hypothetical protein
MKNLKTYHQLFENAGELTPEQVEWLDSCTRGTWTLNPQTGLVDVKGHFNCSEQGLTDFKGVRFGVVSGDFYCYGNRLTTLEGAPQEIGGYFYCENNRLTSLVGAPQEVGFWFSCDHNQLTSLEGAPQKVGGDFICSNNQLTSLEGAPQRVRGSFFCENNQLTSLDGAPREINGIFYSESNPVSEETLRRILYPMEKGKSYIQAMESLWNEIPIEDQALLYRPEFEWVSPEEGRKLAAIKAYQGFKGMI